MRSLYRGRPRNVAPGDTRSPMLRLLSGAFRDGTVEVWYDAQWRTVFKAKRLGFLDDNYPARLTDAGHEWVAKQVAK